MAAEPNNQEGHPGSLVSLRLQPTESGLETGEVSDGLHERQHLSQRIGPQQPARPGHDPQRCLQYSAHRAARRLGLDLLKGAPEKG